MGTSLYEQFKREQEPEPVSPLYEAYLRAKPRDADEVPLTKTERARGLLQAGYQGLTGGLGNKLTAATRAVLPQWMGGTEGFDYSGALEDERAQLDRFRTQHPYASVAAEGVGGSIPALLTAGASPAVNAALKTTQLPATLGTSARIGGAYGGAYSVGERDNPSPGEAVTAGVVGTTLGAGLGAAIHGATKLPGAVMDYTGTRPSTGPTAGAASRIARRAGVQTVEDRAPQMILGRLRRGDMTLDDVMAQHADATRVGAPATLIDLGGNQMTRMARGTQGVPGRGSEQVRAMLTRRREGQPVRVAGDVEQGLGQQRQDAFQLRQEISGRQLAKAKPLYDEALSAPDVPLDTPVQSDEGSVITLADLLKRPSGQKAVSYGKQLAAEKGEEFSELAAPSVLSDLMGNLPPEALARFNAAAKAQGVQVSPSISMQELHSLKLRMDEMLGYAKANGSLPDGTPATKAMLRAIENTKNQIRGVMDTHTGGKYAEARQAWAGEAELDDALALGEGFLNSKTPIGELKHELSQFSEAGREYARVGVTNALRDMIDRAQDGADVTRRVFGNEAIRQRIRAMFPDEKSFQFFREQMEAESQLAKNENFVLGGSQTAEKLSDASDIMGQAPPATMSPSGIMNAIARSKALERLRAMSEQRVDALAPYLTAGGPTRPGAVSGSPQEREKIIRALIEAERKQKPRAIRANVTRALAGQFTSGATRP